MYKNDVIDQILHRTEQTKCSFIIIECFALTCNTNVDNFFIFTRTPRNKKNRNKKPPPSSMH